MLRFLRFAAPAAISLILPLAFVSAASGNVRHTVVEGDTLSYLARVYATTISEVVELNGISDPNLIITGQELIFPGNGESTPEPAAPVSGDSYTIQPGDTLSWIANHFGVPMDQIQAANGIENPGFIIAGHTITIPRPASEPALVPKLEFPLKPYDPGVEQLIDEFAAAYGVSPSLVKALATVESGWSQGAVSGAGARGVMQLMPGTAIYLETSVFGYEFNEEVSVYDNVKMGIKYLQVLLFETNGNERLAVASYYQGLTPTQQGVFYPDTEDYVDMIFRVRDTYWP